MTSSTANTRRSLMENAATDNDSSHLISQFWQQLQESRDQLYRIKGQTTILIEPNVGLSTANSKNSEMIGENRLISSEFKFFYK